jgi:DNA ligase D-like protein (predicted ligase)
LAPRHRDRAVTTEPDLFAGPLAPMLSRSAGGPFDSPEFLFELKWDGYRAIAFLGDGRTRLQSRNLLDLTPHYPGLAGLHDASAGRKVILDGEIVALADGKPDFGRLQRGEGPVRYVAFDLLYAGGVSLLSRPLAARREALREMLDPAAAVAPVATAVAAAATAVAAAAVAPAPGGGGLPLLVSEAFPERGTALFEAARRLGLEGIMAKRASSPYRPGVRSPDWLKIRNVKTADCVIIGYTRGRGFGGLGALVLGATRRDGRLSYIGSAGSGLSADEADRLLRLMGPPQSQPPLGAGAPPATGASLPLGFVPPALRRQDVVWVAPSLVCEVGYTEVTAEGRLRHPVYRGLRLDKTPAECDLP